MKKIISFLIVSAVIVAISFGIYNLDAKYKLNIVYDDIQWTINNKDCLNAVSFDFDNDGNIYVAYKNSVERINEDNKVERLLSNDTLKIYDIAVYKNYLIISSGNSIVKYDLDTGTFSDIVNNIPNNGINNEIKLLIKGDILYAMIGSIGNPVLYKGNDVFSIKNMALFKNIKNIINMEYIYYYLLLVQNDMKKYASGGVQSFVSLTYLRNYFIPIPPISEQKRIVNKVKELSKTIKLLAE